MAAASFVGIVLAAGTLAGGLFPDRPGYHSRAPEPFFRTMLAIGPGIAAGWAMTRRAAAPRGTGSKTIPTTARARLATTRAAPPLGREQREAAIRAVDLLDQHDEALVALIARGDTKADLSASEAYALLTGLDEHPRLCQSLPLLHPVLGPLLESGGAYVDATRLTLLALGQAETLGIRPEAEADYVAAIAERLGAPGRDAAAAADVALTAIKAVRGEWADMAIPALFGVATQRPRATPTPSSSTAASPTVTSRSSQRTPESA